MHVLAATLHPDRFPTRDYYPFKLPTLQQTTLIPLAAPVTMFVGENGTGKSTLLEALARVCDIPIWRYEETARVARNPYEDRLHECLTVEWAQGRVPGSFFGADSFRRFAYYLEEWAVRDPGQLEYFGGKSLLTQSHGQSLMSYFRSRYRIKGMYLLDEPETALSPKSQLELLEILTQMSAAGHAQFIVASHSPLLLACPGAVIYSFDHAPVRRIAYEETPHYRIYKEFLRDR
jgi:predicted ATPase